MVNAPLARSYRALGLSLVDCYRDPDRRVIGGVLRGAAPGSDLAARNAHIVFEPGAVLVMFGRPGGAPFVLPYGELRSLEFSPSGVRMPRPWQSKGIEFTRVELTWKSGSLSLRYMFARPDVCRERYAVVLERIEAAQRAG
jgi:hypothetical protein